MDTPRCRGVRRDGASCQAPPHAVNAAGWCWAHSPENAAARRAARAKGGQNRATAKRVDKLVPATLRPMISALLGALDEVHAGDLDPRAASAMAALAGAITRAYSVGVLEERLAALEVATAAEGRPA